MAVHLYDVVNEGDLTRALQDGYVRQQFHPTFPLAILNYTEKAAYEEVWNDTTKACRGLIYHSNTLEVVARGFVKFFNHGQNGAPDIPLDAPVHVTDKVDGSLGIIYPVPSGGYAVATRGSFTSDQALHATELLRNRYADYQPFAAQLTTLVEIVYPQNRIVLDYQGMDDLVYVGEVALRTGTVVWGTAWPGPTAQTFPHATFADALAMPPRENAEGIVVRTANGDMVKIKQADYVELHRIVTNLTARKVHDWMLTGKPIEEFVAPLPDEFHPWCRQVHDDIIAAADAEDTRICVAYYDILDKLPYWFGMEADPRRKRAEFAKLAAPHPDKWALFAMYDGKFIWPELLKRARPAPYLTPTGLVHTEDTA